MPKKSLEILLLLFLLGFAFSVAKSQSLLVQTFNHTLENRPIGKSKSELRKEYKSYRTYLADSTYSKFSHEFEIWEEPSIIPSDISEIKTFRIGFHFFKSKCSAVFFEDTLYQKATVDTLISEMKRSYGKPTVIHLDEEQIFDIIYEADIQKYTWRHERQKIWIEHKRMQNKALVVFEDTLARAKTDSLIAINALTREPQITNSSPIYVSDSLFQVINQKQIYDLLVSREGKVIESNLIRGDSVLIPYAKRALEKWTFKPALNEREDSMSSRISVLIIVKKKE